jgi:hypothetical protein
MFFRKPRTRSELHGVTTSDNSGMNIVLISLCCTSCKLELGSVCSRTSLLRDKPSGRSRSLHEVGQSATKEHCVISTCLVELVVAFAVRTVETLLARDCGASLQSSATWFRISN